MSQSSNPSAPHEIVLITVTGETIAESPRGFAIVPTVIGCETAGSIAVISELSHLDPKHHSNLAEILAKGSPIPVQQAADGMEIAPNHLYVIPPDAGLEIAGRALRMTQRSTTTPGPHVPIDRFLRSLARECGSRALGVILSGAGTDGAAVLEAVKDAGGVTFAQEPTTAKFGSMPQAAMLSGRVDFILSPEAIAAALAKLGQHPYIAEDEATESLRSADAKDQFEAILTLLRYATGVDFALYRENTVRRRIMRRLALRNMSSLEDYRVQIENDPQELSALHHDLLISVTCFFRDPESFESLKKLVFPRLVQRLLPHTAIRIWVPGCATGEEVYSIGITLQEYFEETGYAYPVQIFASDISLAAVEKARTGKYAENIAADVSPKRLKRHFSKVEGGYQISKALREMCAFSRHDLIQDPPFSKLDLISCRNVLIFFGAVRRNVIALFHYALKPGGFLVLGPSEGDAGDLFSILDGARNIYTRIETVGRFRPPYSDSFHPRRSRDEYKKVGGLFGGRACAEYRPAKTAGARSPVEIRRSRGGGGRDSGGSGDPRPLAPYLTVPAGKANLNLLKLIPETRLLLEVEKLCRDVQQSGEPARKERIPFQADGASGEINVEVSPLGGAVPRALLVLFGPATGESRLQRVRETDPKEREIASLKQDLADARERLLSILDEHRSSDEVNNDAVEDALSANEELQSLNEELETAKEELQSINEELTTVNQELIANNAAATEARDFARLIMDTAAAPLLVLDTDLRIKTANPAFYRWFQLSDREAEGHRLYEIANGCWDVPELREMLQRILPESKIVQDFEIRTDVPGIGRRVFVVSARQLNGAPQILLGIDDTERSERAEATLHESEERFRNMADAAPVMIWVAGPDQACTFFNKGWLDFTGRTMQQELDNGWIENVHPEDLDRRLGTYGVRCAPQIPNRIPLTARGRRIPMAAGQRPSTLRARWHLCRLRWFLR